MYQVVARSALGRLHHVGFYGSRERAELVCAETEDGEIYEVEQDEDVTVSTASHSRYGWRL